jgi:hypothetical protein
MQNENKAPEDRTIEGSVMEVKAPDNALVVLNPELYADELFAPFSTELTTAKRRAARASYDVTTREGMITAKELVRTFVKIRTRADKAKTEAKRPIDQAGKAILARFNALRDAAEAEEAKHAKVIADEEKRLADVQSAKLAAERARTEAIESRIAHLRSIPQQMANADSESIAVTLESMATMRLEPTQYDEHLNEALTVLNESVDLLRQHHEAALVREAEQRRIKEERAELMRLREAQIAAEQRQRAEADEQQRLVAAERKAAAEVMQQKNQMMAIMLMSGLPHSILEQGKASDRAVVEAALSKARAFEPGDFGTMAPMARIARDTALTMLEDMFAQLPAEAPIVEEIQPPLVDMLHGEQDIPVPEPIIMIDPAPEPQRAIPAPRRPSDLDILQVVAEHFGAPSLIALSWLATVDIERLRRDLAGA